MSRFLAFLKDDSGATAIEYGLIAAGISIVIMVRSRASAAASMPGLTPSRPRSSNRHQIFNDCSSRPSGRLFFYRAGTDKFLLIFAAPGTD
jgi:Flp/Fap pilin component